MLSLSVKTHYALLAMLELAERSADKPVQLRSIINKYELPHNYVEQAMIVLKQKGLVNSFRGSQGGYQLAKATNEITILEILEAIEGPISLTNKQNKHSEHLRFFWHEIDKNLHKNLTISLQSLLEKKIANKRGLDYII